MLKRFGTKADVLLSFLGVIGLGFTPLAVLAQAGGYGGFIHLLPFTGGTLGSGAAAVVMTSGYASLTSNPAALGLTESAAAGFGIVAFPDGTKLQYVGINSWPRTITVGVGLSEFYAGAIPAYDESGERVGTIRYTSTSLHTAVSVRALSGVTFGLGYTVHLERVGGVPRGVGLGSVGAAIRVNDRIAFAASLLKAAYASAACAASEEYWFATSGIRADLASFVKLALAFQSDPGGTGLGGGVEVSPSLLWNVRLGWRPDGPTWGIGFDLGGLRVSVDNAVVDQLTLTVAEISIQL